MLGTGRPLTLEAVSVAREVDGRDWLIEGRDRRAKGYVPGLDGRALEVEGSTCEAGA